MTWNEFLVAHCQVPPFPLHISNARNPLLTWELQLEGSDSSLRVDIGNSGKEVLLNGTGIKRDNRQGTNDIGQGSVHETNAEG